MIDKIREFLHGEEGATAIEYGLIAAGIAIGIVVVVFAIGGDLAAQLETLQGYL